MIKAIKTHFLPSYFTHIEEEDKDNYYVAIIHNLDDITLRELVEQIKKSRELSVRTFKTDSVSEDTAFIEIALAHHDVEVTNMIYAPYMKVIKDE